MANFVSYANATDLMTAIGQKLKALNGAYVFKGNSAFASIPATPTEAQAGYVYNITDAFTTDARFVEGAGKKYPAGTNIAIADLSTYDAVTPQGSENPSEEGWYELVSGKYVLSADETVDSGKTYYEKTVSVKYDVISSFIDVDALEQAIADVSAMITAEFDETQAYAVGALCTYEGDLYKFTTAHTANDPWDATEVSAVTVADLISAVDTRVSGVNNRVSAVVADIAPAFDANQAYAIDAIVVHDDGLYKFTSAHTAGDPWDATEVSAVTVSSLISAAEPNALTTAEVNTLIGLLD